MKHHRPTRTRLLLRDERGASFVLALMLVMVCTVVSLLVVSTAATNAERGQQHAREERAYYAVLSAADQGAALYRAYAPAVRMELSSVGTSHARYTTSRLSNKDSWRYELELWATLAASGQTKEPFTCTAQMVNDALDKRSKAATPHVQISYQMDPTTYDVTVTAWQVGQDKDYGHALQQVVAKNAAVSSQNSTERLVSWNNNTAPSLSKSSAAAGNAPAAGSVDKKLARLYTAWQSPSFDWSSISWKRRTDARGVAFMAVQDKGSSRVPLVWYGGAFYKATYDGADYPALMDGFDVRDHLLLSHPLYSGETKSGTPVSVVWQEVSA